MNVNQMDKINILILKYIKWKYSWWIKNYKLINVTKGIYEILMMMNYSQCVSKHRWTLFD